MSRLPIYTIYSGVRQHTEHLLTLCLVAILLGSHGITSAEGTKQLEPMGAPSKSVCKLVLSQNMPDNRIPFALLDCSEEYRLNIHISDHNTETIYLGFGDVVDYFDGSIIYNDVNYRVKDPSGQVVNEYPLNILPHISGNPGFINTRSQAEAGPRINGTNTAGYIPLVLDPKMNGDYVIEFQLPAGPLNTLRVFKYFDITVAKNNAPVPGRLWSKAWQLATGSVTADVSASYSLFYIYTSDSIVTRFDCNGLAGGVWTIYSNEWGCSTTGSWDDRRQSTPGNATVRPQYKIFLNDPDMVVFPSGHIGELIDFKILKEECDTVITFATHVSKGGNIEILLDVPPMNPGITGPEDVQLGYSVTAGYNILLPAWDGKNSYGIPVENGTGIIARVGFLNGLSNLPLYDVEDNPQGFKVDIQRPLPVSGNTKLKLFWDDTQLQSRYFPTRNITDGCLYSGSGFQSGCHRWTRNQGLGDTNTINSWWYLTTDQVLEVPLTLKLRPSSGNITGPVSICDGQEVSFRTSTISYARKYIWHVSGPGFEFDYESDAPDTTFTHEFPVSMLQGNYSVSVFGRNPQCFDGEKVFYTSFVYDYIPATVGGLNSVCNSQTNQYQIPGSYSSIRWSAKNGQIIGSADANTVTINWHTSGKDTLLVNTTDNDCGKRLIILPIDIHPEAAPGFSMTPGTGCPGIPVTFADTSFLPSGAIVSRSWEWGSSQSANGNDSLVMYSYPSPGDFAVKLRVTTDHGCTTETSRQIRIMPAPRASFSMYSNCISQPIQLLDNSTGSGLTTWNWDFGPAPATTSNLSLRNPEAVFHSTGQFPVRLVVGNNYGCNDTVIQEVIIHNRPVALFKSEYPCQGTQITFTDQSIAADAILTGFTWRINSGSGDERTFQGNQAVIVFENAVNYNVTHITTDLFGCSDTISQIIKINPRPDAAFEIIENPENNNSELHFDNQTSGATEYSWNFGNGISSTLFEPVIKYNREGEYEIMLIVINPEGCMDTAINHYYYMPGLWLPNAFTPDNSGYNDIFKPVTQRTTLDPFQLLIYNRWGQLVFESSNPAKGWDGTFNGAPCPAGSYSYLLQYREAEIESSGIVTLRGMVSLIR